MRISLTINGNQFQEGEIKPMATSTQKVISCITVYSQTGLDEIRKRYPNIVVDVTPGTNWVIRKGAGYSLHEIRDWLAENKHAHDVDYHEAA
jgi:hypothetical protein